MTLWLGLLLTPLLAGLGWWLGRRRAWSFADAAGGSARLHSRPSYHGVYVAVCTVVPAVLLLVAGAAASDRLVAGEVMAAMPAEARPTTDLDRAALLAEVRGVVQGDYLATFDPAAAPAADAWRAAALRYALMFGGGALLLGLGCGWLALRRLGPQFRARLEVERLGMVALVTASLVAILTTFGIMGSLLYETVRFFQLVSPGEFLFGTQWSPQTAIRADQVGSSGAFGAVPLFWGTVFIGAILAMIIAVPLGLMSAVYLSQYARPGFRRMVKPTLEVLAAVPTVIYGFFAAQTVAPAVRQLGLALGVSNASAESALAAGVVMAAMIIPFIASMADDALVGVPRSMLDGSLAIGATRWETIRGVLLPTAMPGIRGGVLLAVSRAIGETMIVVMAASLAANLTANPFEAVTTVTVQIVALLTGDQQFSTAKTLSAFALGLALFLVTLALNIHAISIQKRHREAYG